jgi:hypothetical protein
MGNNMGYGQYSDAPKVSKPSLKTETTKRLKHVFDNPAHVWANPIQKDGSGFEQTEAWNPQKNFYFKTVDNGTRVLYSYRDTYPIGTRFVHKNKPVFLIRSGSPYSNTTAQHISQGRQAVSHSAIRFDVAYVCEYDLSTMNQSGHHYGQAYPRDYRGKPNAITHKANLADIIYRINEAIQESVKAHSLRSITYARDNASKLISQAKQYAKLFNVKLPKLPAIPKLTPEKRAKALAFDNNRTERDNKKHAARAAQWAEQRRLDALSREEKIAAWRQGSSARFWNLTGDNYALLRVKDSNVETSQGVTVPINGLLGAGRLLRFLTACKDANRPYERNGHTEHIGQFTVESFKPAIATAESTDATKPEWILTAGCHRIKWEEIASIADSVREAYKQE